MEPGETDHLVEHSPDVLEGHGIEGLAELRVQRISSDASTRGGYRRVVRTVSIALIAWRCESVTRASRIMIATKVSLRYAKAAESASGTLVAPLAESTPHLPDDLPVLHVHAPTPKLLKKKRSILDLANVGPNRVDNVLCRKERERSGSAVRVVLDEGPLTVVLAKEAFDGIMTLLDHAELERRAQEPIPHLGATERGPSEICDTCGGRRAQNRFLSPWNPVPNWPPYRTTRALLWSRASA